MADDPRRPAGYPPSGVAERMDRLRVLCVPELVAEARLRRLFAQRPPTTDVPSATAVARALAELRSLCDLASHLRRR